VEVVTDRAKLAGQFSPESFPPSLTEGSARPEQSVASLVERGAARSEWFRGHPQDGHTLRAIWGRPAGCRGLGRVECPQEMMKEHKHKRRTKGRAT
jgi:hypothetical protein